MTAAIVIGFAILLLAYVLGVITGLSLARPKPIDAERGGQ